MSTFIIQPTSEQKYIFSSFSGARRFIINYFISLYNSNHTKLDYCKMVEQLQAESKNDKCKWLNTIKIDLIKNATREAEIMIETSQKENITLSFLRKKDNNQSFILSKNLYVKENILYADAFKDGITGNFSEALVTSPISYAEFKFNQSTQNYNIILHYKEET